MWRAVGTLCLRALRTMGSAFNKVCLKAACSVVLVPGWAALSDP